MEHVILLFHQLSFILAARVTRSARSLCSPAQHWHGSPACGILCRGKAQVTSGPPLWAAPQLLLTKATGCLRGLQPSRKEAK